TGHCFHIGGTTHYLVNGINPDIVKVLGRWKSDVFQRYWRNLKILGILHTECMEGDRKTSGIGRGAKCNRARTNKLEA
ncbi:hypothetical protein IW262DRAFT_1262014, partial [Armillaria fumosa]